MDRPCGYETYRWCERSDEMTSVPRRGVRSNQQRSDVVTAGVLATEPRAPGTEVAGAAPSESCVSIREMLICQRSSSANDSQFAASCPPALAALPRWVTRTLPKTRPERLAQISSLESASSISPLAKLAACDFHQSANTGLILYHAIPWYDGFRISTATGLSKSRPDWG